MINILVIEDEKPAYDNLKRFIEKVPGDYRIIDWLKSVHESVKWLAKNKQPELIFLDIQLSDGIAFEIFEQVEVHSPIIFSTAYDEYAIKAFELNSVDYLLKPISYDSVYTALNKFLKYYLARGSLPDTPYQKKIDRLVSDLAQMNNNFTDNFLVKRGNELIKLPTKNIAYIYVDEVTFCVADNGRTYSLNQSLSVIARTLDPKVFYRLNRKVICNIIAIKKVKRILGSKLSIELNHKPDFDVLVSREKTRDFKNWFQKV